MLQLPVTHITATVAVFIKPLLKNSYGTTLNQITYTVLINIFATLSSANCPGYHSSGASSASIASNGSLLDDNDEVHLTNHSQYV